MTRSRWGLVALALAFFAYAVSTARVGFTFYDDGVFTNGAWSVAHGRLPYRDFWTLYNPGQFLLAGAFFRYVNESVAALRILESALVAGCGLAAFDLCRRVYGPKAAIVSASGVVLWLGSGLYPFHEGHVLPALLLTLASADLVIAGLRSESRRAVAAGALCAGLAVAIRQDALAYVVVPELLALGLSAYLHRGKPRLTRAPLAYVAGLAAPLAGLAGWVLAVDPGRYWADAIVFPLTKNSALRDLPFHFERLDLSLDGGAWEALQRFVESAKSNVVYLVPLIVALAGIAVVAAYVFKPKLRMGIPSRSGFALLVLLLVFSFDYARLRSDFPHIFPSVLLTFLVAPGVVTAAARRVDSTLVRRAGAGALALVGLLALVMPVVAKAHAAHLLLSGDRYDSGLLAGIVATEGESDRVDEAAAYVRTHTEANDEIFVMSNHNDVLLGNNVGFYPLVERPSASGYPELYPGVTTTEEAQRAIVAALESSRAPFVIRWPVQCSEPNDACRTVGSHLLDEYVGAHYSQVADFGVMTIEARD